ncbi:MAG: hypothetical protein C4293_05710 [Nitrospiraceae bacterium]
MIEVKTLWCNGGVPRSKRQPAQKNQVRGEEHRTTSESTLHGEQPFPDEQFRLMVEAVIDYAIYMLDPEGRIMSRNPGAQRLRGYSPSEVIGRHYSMFFPEDAIRRSKPHQELERARVDGRFEEEG